MVRICKPSEGSEAGLRIYDPGAARPDSGFATTDDGDNPFASGLDDVRCVPLGSAAGADDGADAGNVDADVWGDASELPLSPIVRLLESARLNALNAKAQLDAAITEEDVYRGYETQQLAERAVRIVGGEVGREWMMGFAWAAKNTPDEVEDLMTRLLTGRLKGLLQQVQQEVKRLDGLVRQQRATSIELRIAADRLEAARA